MLVVLASDRDLAARRLVERWAAHDARLMVLGDLSSPGWRLASPGSAQGYAAIGGAIVPCSAITGVVTRIPWVRPLDLPQIAEPDREYVAAEYAAFLTAWLDGLACPVVNRPSAACLMGPTLSHERWLVRAARAGLRLATRVHRAPDPHRPFAKAVATIVGERWFGDVAPELGVLAIRLARQAGVELLTALFSSGGSDGEFLGADPMIDVTPDIADALLARLGQLAVQERA